MRGRFRASTAILFIGLQVWLVSFLGTRPSSASDIGDPAIAEGPVCDTAEQVKSVVIETDHHGEFSAAAASAELYGDKACMHATFAFVRESDDSTFLITDEVVTVSAITVYGFQIDNHWIKIRPPIKQYTAFVEKAVGVGFHPSNRPDFGTSTETIQS